MRTTLLALCALIAITAIQIGAPHLLGQNPGSIDYLIFHQVGELAGDGRVALAYDAPAFEAHQAARPEGGAFMPWTYPPQANLLSWALALVPPGLGYALFCGAGLAALIWGLFRLAPAQAVPALMLTLPAWVMNIRAGQNGFLTALLFALVFLLALRTRPGAAGIPLGLLAYKPHLGLGLGLVALFRGGWRMVLAATLTLGAVLALATWMFGAAIWPAFLQSVHDSGQFLRAGGYPMERMTSLFALLTSLGAPADIALPAQGAMALLALALVGYGLVRRWQMAHLLSLSVFAGLGVSPYGYDYDLVALAPGLALAGPAIAIQASKAERSLLALALLLATGWGLVTVILATPLPDLATSLPALGAIGYLGALLLVFTMLRRAERTQPA